MTASPDGDGEAAAIDEGKRSPAFELKPAPRAEQIRMDYRRPAAPSADEIGGPGSIDEISRVDVMATIREVFRDGQPRDREAAIRDVAAALGYQRVGSKIREFINTDLIAAVHRGVLCNDGQSLEQDCKTIGHYPLDLLRKYLLGVMGQTWWDQQDAIRAAARHLGFRRAGSAIEKAFKSAINSGLRRSELERDGQRLRKR